MPKISVYIIAFNEVEKIKQCINSVLWADEIILADSNSTDGTSELAESMGAKVIHIEFKGYGNLRNEALRHCSYDWILSIDADERCTEKVHNEIKKIVVEPEHDIYHIPRRNFFMGKWIKFSGWYPNYRQPQFFRREKMAYDDKPVHEGFINLSSKPIGHLKNSIWQIPFKNTEEIIHKANKYSTLGVAKLEARNIKSSVFKAFTHGSWAFIKHYIFKLGILDGGAGFVIAFGNFEGTFYRYIKLYEKQSAWKQPDS